MRWFAIALALMAAAPADAIENISGSYYVRLNGPTIGRRKLKENYNPYLSGPDALHLFHSLSVGYRWHPLWRAGIGASGIQYITSGVRNSFGTVIDDPESLFFHPSLWITRYSLWETSLFSLSGKLSFFIPTSQFARDQTQLTSIDFSQSWNIKGLPAGWSAALASTVEATVYRHSHRDINNPNDLDRRVLFFSAGHFIGYRISPRFGVANSSTFDIGRFSGASGLPGYNSTSSDDRMQFSMNYYPAQKFMVWGAYLQAMIDRPALTKTNVGIDLSLYF